MCRKIFFLLIIFSVTNQIWSYDWLGVRNPQGWQSMQGTIEKASVSVKPKGMYMEVGLYLTFSARDWYYNNTDSLEVEFYFDLPQNAVVHDSWLWVEDEIIKGKIMDKWTASAIYEDIVNRRRDPSILYKNWGNSYELRIYPMLATETRKVKITYLVPAEINSKNIFASLPTNLLRASKNPVSPFYLLTWADDEWSNPSILEYPEIEFRSLNDPEFGNYFRADLPSEAIQNNIHFSLDSPLQNGLYVNRFEKDDEGFYQLAFLPSKALDLSVTKKVAILFDYDASNTTITTDEVLQSVKSYIKSNLTENDSINLIFSQLSIKRASEKWISANPGTIDDIFSGLGEKPISSYSNLPSLIANGIDFVKQNGNDGNIILLSSSDQVGDYKVANQLLDDLIELMNPKIPIHVADFQNQNYEYNYIGGRYYDGNEYFYTNISRITSANNFSTRFGYSFPQLISAVISSVSGFMSSFDLHTSLENGHCYSRFNIGDANSTVYLDKPIIQIGKYKGELPFLIEASGVYENNAFSEKFNIPESNIYESDSSSAKAWTGNYIEVLENKDQTNDVVSEIVDKSINERVLSIYSAFLCLEPSRGGEVCYDCLDESSLVGIEKETEETDSLSLSAYPNPFNNAVQIRVAMPSSQITEGTSFKIFNVLGEQIKSFEYNLNNQTEVLNFTWFGKNDSGVNVSSGIYYFVAQTKSERFSIKLLYLK